jgi:hypothetical protein
MNDDQNTTSTAELSSEAGSVNMVDQIADLLLGESEKPTEQKKKPIEESEEADTQPDDSTQEDDYEAEGEESDEVEDDNFDDSDEEVTWAKTLGIDEKNVVLDDDGNLSGINVKVDGKVTTVGVKDLIAGYQSNKSNTNKSKQLAEQRKEFDTIKVAVANEYTQKIETIDRLTQHLKDILLGSYKDVDWNRLRVENPGEYAAAVQDFNFRNSEIEQIANAVGQEKQGINQQMTAEQQAMQQEFIKSQADKVIEKNPSWAKPEVFRKAVSEMTEFLSDTYGFTQEEFANTQDARLFEVIKDAMKYRSSVKTAKTKLDVQIPKYQKSTGKTTKALTKLDRLTKTAKSSQGYQKRNAETDAVAELLSGLYN